MQPSSSGAVVSAASSSALSALLASPFAVAAMCSNASSSIFMFSVPRPRSLSANAARIAFSTSCMVSG